MPELTTERLLLRRWRASDKAPFAALNADPEVMRHFPASLAPRASDELADRLATALASDGFGLWAIEERATGRFAGFTGIQRVSFRAHFTPAVETGWRLAREAWGRGFATEAARAATAFGFDALGLEEVVSFTVPANTRSRAVMERLGMTHAAADDFDHPRVAHGDLLRRHVLYRLRRADQAYSRR